MKNILFVSILCFFCLGLSVSLSCTKDITCNSTECTDMLECVNDVCDCPSDSRKVAGTLCAKPWRFPFLAIRSEGSPVPNNMLLHLPELDKLIGDSTTYLYGGIKINSTGPDGLDLVSDYQKASFAPDGYVGDKFRYRHPFPIFLAGPDKGRCYLLFEGTFTHPDTLRTLVTLVDCFPENIPEANNKYRTVFVRIK